MRFGIFADLFPLVADDEDQFGEIGKFEERFEEVVEDGTARDMEERLRGRERVGSESPATPCGRDNDFHQGAFLL